MQPDLRLMAAECQCMMVCYPSPVVNLHVDTYIPYMALLSAVHVGISTMRSCCSCGNPLHLELLGKSGTSLLY